MEHHDNSVLLFQVNPAYLHELSSVPTHSKTISVVDENGQHYWISSSRLITNIQVNTSNSGVSRPVVPHNTHQMHQEQFRGERVEHSNPVAPVAPVYKASILQNITEEQHQQYHTIFNNYITGEVSIEPYAIWNQSHALFQRIKVRVMKQEFLTNSIMRDDLVTRSKFTLGMFLFSVCIWSMIANIAANNMEGLFNLFLPLMSYHLTTLWPITKKKFDKQFWKLINLPRCKRQALGERVSEKYARYGIQSSTHGTGSINFTIFNIADVIKFQLNDPSYVAALQEGYERERKEQVKNGDTVPESEREYEEYTDGDICRNLRTNGLLKYSHILSFQGFADGVRLHRDGHTGLTAVYLVNTHIPLYKRFDESNIIVVALMSSKANISYRDFLLQVVGEINRSLTEIGIHMTINGTDIVIGGLVTSFIVDIKERDELLCMNSGFFRCPYCYHHGNTYPPHTSVCFPVTGTKPKKRTYLSFKLDAKFGSKESPMRGVLNSTPLLDLPGFDPTTMVPVEVMHTFDLGIIKYMLLLWTGLSKKKTNASDVSNPWELTIEQCAELERRINKIRLPHYFTRHLPFDDRASWKADRKLKF